MKQVNNSYFQGLYNKFIRYGISSKDINSGIVSRRDMKLLESIYMPDQYIKQIEITKLLRDKIENTNKGIISIFMERGTGKSVFANKLDGLYHQTPLIKNGLIRTYHISTASLRGMNDFVNSINSDFRNSFNHDDDIFGSSANELPMLTLNCNDPSNKMAYFLNFFHKLYQKDYTLLVLDGIDELTKQTENIIQFIPSTELLNDGVFIVLLSRFKDEENITGENRSFIEWASNNCDAKIEVRRHDKINKDLLMKYINKQKDLDKLSDTEKEQLIIRSDYRFLYLKAYIVINSTINFTNSSETEVIANYFSYLFSFYGPTQLHDLKQLITTFALFPGISMNDYQEHFYSSGITYEFIGLLNDIMPILTVTHRNGVSCYELADMEYNKYVLEEFENSKIEVIDDFNDSLNRELYRRLQNICYDHPPVINGDNSELLKNLEIDQNVIEFFIDGTINILKYTQTNNGTNKYDVLLKCIHIFRQCINNISWYKLEEFVNVRILLDEFASYLLDDIYNIIINDADNEVLSAVNNEIVGDGFDDSYVTLMDMFYNTNNFKKLYDYIIENFDEIRNINKFFWLFVECVNNFV